MNTQEALQALVAKDKRHEKDAVSFVGTTARIGAWLEGRGPTGPNLIKLRIYLLENGFKPSELNGIHPSIIDFARAFSRGLITEADACTKIEVIPRTMYDLMLGKRGASKRVLVAMKAYLRSVRGKSPLTEETVSSNGQETSTPQLFASSVAMPLGENQALEILCHGINMIAPIAAYLASDECSPETRRAFRQRCGLRTLSEVSTNINRLCSETTRRVVDKT